MSDKGHKESTHKKISECERLKFIGFDVFPEEPKDLFLSEAEKQKLVDEVRFRREHHDHLRGDCTLLEDRVSPADRIFLTAASVIIVLALFLPWYAAYNEIVEETKPVQSTGLTVTPAENLGASSTAVPADSAAPEQAAATTVSIDTALSAVAEPAGTSAIGGEELITTVMARKKIHKEYARLSGLGAVISIGSVGAYVFSSGLALILTVVLFIVYTLLCIGLPIYNLYGIYGFKGEADAQALKLKKLLRLNWLPLVIFALGLLLSFFGNAYAFKAAELFTSIGESYNPIVFFGTLSWGVFVSLACFILCAAKGAEI